MNFTWEKGRSLSTINDNISYQYNGDGIRTQKMVDGQVTNYYLNGSTILTQVRGNDRLDFYYDHSGSLFGFNYNGTSYYYIFNAQLDVIGILDSNGNTVVNYSYDSWGNPISITGSLADTIGQLNPFRYRRYYYDIETGFYYVNTRYYDPKICRFINSDAIVDNSKISGENLFIYCLGNPISYSDPDGLCAKAWAAGYQGPCPGQGKPGCMDNWPQFKNSNTKQERVDKESAPDHPAYVPPKKKNGGARKVRVPNSNEKGWIAKDGGIWVPDNNMHGGAGWTVQYPDGSHWHAYPNGETRFHDKIVPDTGTIAVGGVLIFAGVITTVILIADNVTGVGTIDDPALSVTIGMIMKGFEQVIA